MTKSKVQCHRSWPSSQHLPFSSTSRLLWGQLVNVSFFCSLSAILTVLLFIQRYPSNEKKEERKKENDLLSHIHSAVGSSFLWLCHPPFCFLLLLYSLSPSFSLFRDSFSVKILSGIRSCCVHSLSLSPRKLMSRGLRQAFLAQRPGQSQAAVVMWPSHLTHNCWGFFFFFRTTTSVTLYTWPASGLLMMNAWTHTHTHTSTHAQRRHVNEWIKEEQMAGLLPLKNTLIDFCLVWHLMSNLLPLYLLDLHLTEEHLYPRPLRPLPHTHTHTHTSEPMQTHERNYS